MSYQLAGKRVRPKVFYYDYAPSTHSHTRCSRTGSDRQLKRSCRLGHSPFREAKTPKRVEEFFGFSKFWISADKRRSCVISNAVFGAVFNLLAPQHATTVEEAWQQTRFGGKRGVPDASLQDQMPPFITQFCQAVLKRTFKRLSVQQIQKLHLDHLKGFKSF